MSEADRVLMQEIFDKNPELSPFGFGVFESRPGNPGYEQKLAEERAGVFDRGVEQFRNIRVWLRQYDKTRSLNRGVGSSYWLKHQAEHEAGYSANGIFIAAAIAEGFTVKRIVSEFGMPTPNAWINISKRKRKVV